MRNKLTKLINELKWQNFLMLFIAGVINAFGVTVFLAPVKLYDSGISGTSMLLSSVTPDILSLSIFLIILNVPLFLFGLKGRGQPLRFIQFLRLPFIHYGHG